MTLIATAVCGASTHVHNIYTNLNLMKLNNIVIMVVNNNNNKNSCNNDNINIKQ